MKLKLFTTIFLVVTLSYLGYRIFNKIQHKKEIESTIKKMPKFIYKTLKNEYFTNENLNPNKRTIFFYYNSECDFCNHEAKMVEKSMSKFKNAQLIFISFENIAKIKKFAHRHKLANYDNIIFLSDFKLSFASTFDVKSLPTIIMYDEKKILIQKFKGQIRPNMILKHL